MDSSLIVDLHLREDRQGPGSRQETLRALELTGLMDGSQETGLSQPRAGGPDGGWRPGEGLRVADIGCGTGGPTLTLAEALQGRLAAPITAVDLFPEFLERLEERAHGAGLDRWIRTQQASMEKLPFADGEFDLIWSEGAVYNIGFARGVREWRRFLKPGGFLAVSEVTWITPSRPQEVEDFWRREYPEIDTAAGKMRILEENGYTPVGYFPLAPGSWLDNYYRLLEESFPAFLERHGSSEEARAVVREYREEIASYRRFQDYYSYGFYVARRLPWPSGTATP